MLERFRTSLYPLTVLMMVVTLWAYAYGQSIQSRADTGYWPAIDAYSLPSNHSPTEIDRSFDQVLLEDDEIVRVR
jgi:hypothetical protein